MAPIKQVSTSKVAKNDHLGIIHEKVLLIENILKGVRDAEKDNVKQKKRAEQDENRANQEKKLEAKDDKPDKKKLKMPPVPQLGIFGWIKRFIGNVVAAIFLSKMVDHVGMLVGFVKVADKILNFVADVGIKLVDALGTMVEFGYKAYDATRGFLQTIGGNGLAQNFDKVMGLVGTALTLATAITLDAAMDAASGGGDGPGLLDFLKFKKGAAAAKGAATAKGTAAAAAGAKGTAAAAGTAGAGGGAASTVGTVGGIAVGTAAAIITGVGLLASALGEGAFQIKKIGKKPIDDAQKEFDKYSWFNPIKYFWGAALGMQKFLLFPLTVTGLALDVIGAPFRYAIELIRFGIMAIRFGIMALMGDTEGMKKQRTNLAKFDSRIRESVREMLNMLTLGLAFKEKGSFGNIFGDEKAQAEMTKKYAEGGKVKGSKGKTKRRSKTRKKPKKLILKRPPRESIDPLPPMTGKGDDEKQTQNKERAWWDFLGWAGTGEETPLGPAGQQLAEKTRNVGNELGKDDFFGPILRVTSKVILGQDVDPKDHRRVAMGMNLMINEGLKKGKVQQGMFAFNEGGLSDAAGVRPIDASSWIEDSFGSLMRRERTKDFMGTTGSELFTGTTSSSEDQSSGSADLGNINATGMGAQGNFGPKTKAFLDAIAFAEGTFHQKNTGYNTHFAFDQTADLSAHPAIIKSGGGYRSDAFGRYQFMSPTWAGIGGAVNPHDGKPFRPGMDMSPANQDKGAVILILRRLNAAGIKATNAEELEKLLEGEGISKRIATAMSGEWASFPNTAGVSAYGQPVKKLARIQEFYTARSGARAAEVSSSSAAPGPVAQNPGALGSGAGDAGVEIAGKLGDYMKANRSKIGVTGSIHQWLPRHPPKFTRSYKSYHNINRALDIGGWSPSSPAGGGADEQAPVIAALIEWNKKNGHNPVELIHGSPAYRNYGSYREYLLR
jgi:muramidase (phage lysozyme)